MDIAHLGTRKWFCFCFWSLAVFALDDIHVTEVLLEPDAQWLSIWSLAVFALDDIHAFIVLLQPDEWFRLLSVALDDHLQYEVAGLLLLPHISAFHAVAMFPIISQDVLLFFC